MSMPVYFVLNACRVYAYLLEGHIFSKDEGGVWGLRSLPEEFHPIVLQTLEIYRGKCNFEPFDEATLGKLAFYMDRCIKAVCEVKQ